MIFAAAIDEILGLHLVRVMVFVGLAGPATDERREPQIERFVVVAGLCHFNCDVGLDFLGGGALENSLSVALSTSLAGQPMYVVVYCAAVSGSELE